MADLNARIAQPLALWVREQHGEAALRELVRAADLEPSALDGRTQWISLEQFETLLQQARALCADDEAFKRACVHKLVESYGPVRFLLWATSPRRVFEMAARTVHYVSRFSTGDVLESKPTAMVGRIHSSRPISRLVCLSRQAQMAAMPTLWGLPPARLSERACQAQGDEACVYCIEWLEHRRWVPSALGLVMGALVAAALQLGLHWSVPPLAVLPVTFALVGYLYELRRTSEANLKTSSQIGDALAEALRDDNEARRELLELHQRQREWVNVIEEQVGERTQILNDVVERVRNIQASRSSALLGFSHDLRNPLAYLRANAEYLADVPMPADGRAAHDELMGAIDDTEALLKELVTVARADANLVRITAKEMEVPPLADRLRRRLRALVIGRDIKVSVFATREAPPMIETDPLVFDRVIDNVLTNAAKYTARGSIVVEIGGIPGFLSLKISDTGRGMAADQVSGIFHPGGSDSATRAPNSYGVGLSVVVRLLAQVGGKLEVMSKPGSGTTFWIHLPVELPPPQPSPQPAASSEPPAKLVERVVTIRRQAAEA